MFFKTNVLTEKIKVITVASVRTFSSARTFICENLLTSMYQFCILKAQFNIDNFVTRKRSNFY